MQITSTGKGLHVFIRCEYNSLNNWLAMASWYSIYRKMPDAIVEIQCIRCVPIRTLFEWPGKLKIPYKSFAPSFTSEDEKYVELYKLCGNCLWITPYVMAVNEFKEDFLGPSDVKSSENTTFVKLGDSCGKFVLSSWIDSHRAPFARAALRFWEEDASVNEMKVLKLWERMSHFYSKL